MRRHRLALVAAAAGIIAAATVVSPAIAAPAQGTPTPATRDASAAAAKTPSLSWSPIEKQLIKDASGIALRNQNALGDFRDWIMKQRGFATSGYVGSIDDLARKAMTIMWHGPRTPLLTAIIKKGERLGIKVGVQHRKYSLQQIKSAMAAIWTQAAEGKWAGFKVSATAGLGTAENGITVYGTYTPVPGADRAAQVRSLATTEAGVPVHLVPGHSVTLDTSRTSDVSPFNGGDFMGFPLDTSPKIPDACTTGFSIVYNGFDVTTTARHCDEPLWSSWSVYNNGNYPGPADQQYVSSSTLSSDGGARVMDSAGSPLMFDSGPQSTTKLEVVNFYNVGLNDLVCTEGGNSGEHCDLKVVNMLVQVTDDLGSFETIEADAQSDTAQGIAAMQGDSGGPVMSLNGTTTGQVKAVGMIQATMDSLTSCGTSHNYFNSGPPLFMTCGKHVLFSSMLTIVKNLSGACLLAKQGPVCP